MKNIVILIFSVLLFSCNHSASNKVINIKDDLVKTLILDSSKKEKDTIINRKVDTLLLMNLSTEILKSIKTRNYKKLVSFIHPQDGIRFSPYASIDTIMFKKYSGDDLLLLAKQNKPINWNSSWEEDSPELLTIDQYFRKYVYDVDFLNAELKSVNEFHSHGTDLNTINEVYPDCDVIEFYFSGFDKKFEGMDFRALRLVFKFQNNHPYLIAIVHDEWTP